jgi:hypothetical protein
MKFIKSNTLIEKCNGNHIQFYSGKILLLTLWILLILLMGISYSQSLGRVATTAAPFLKIGVGGRALGMGEASATIAEDVTALYWNPAGLAGVNKMELTVSHYDYIADLYYDFGGIAIPVQGIGTFGLFMANLGMPDIERTTVESPEGTGEKVSAGSFVIGAGYARALTDRFSIGGNVKYIRETIWHSSASSFAFDVGVLYKAFFKNIMIGMSISNFGTEMKMEGRDMLTQHDVYPTYEGNNPNINAHLDTDEFPLPILFRVGISSNITKDILNIREHDWIIAIDAIHPNDNKEYMNVGTELKLFNLIAMRAGFRQLFLEDREGGLTLGFGIQYNIFDIDFKLDYANVDYGRLDHHNKFSLILAF